MGDNAALKEFSRRLHHNILEDIMYKEEIYYLPTSITLPYSFYANEALVQEIGLTISDLPTTLVDLFIFLETWECDFAQEYPDVTPFYSYALPYIGVNDMIGLVLAMYKDAMLFEEKPLDYDTDVFRTLINNANRYTIPSSDRIRGDTMFDIPQRQQTLMYCDYVWSDLVFFQLSGHTRLAPLSIDENHGRYQAYFLDLTFINPYSENQAEAQELFQYLIDYPDPVLLCALSNEEIQPIEKPDYAETLDFWTAQKEEAERLLQDDSLIYAQKNELMEIIRFVDEEIINNEVVIRYQVSPDAILEYQEKIMPYLRSRGKTPYDTHLIDESIEMIVQTYLDGAIGLEDLVLTLNRTVDILLKEGLNM